MKKYAFLLKTSQIYFKKRNSSLHVLSRSGRVESIVFGNGWFHQIKITHY